MVYLSGARFSGSDHQIARRPQSGPRCGCRDDTTMRSARNPRPNQRQNLPVQPVSDTVQRGIARNYQRDQIDLDDLAEAVRVPSPTKTPTKTFLIVASCAIGLLTLGLSRSTRPFFDCHFDLRVSNALGNRPSAPQHGANVSYATVQAKNWRYRFGSESRPRGLAFRLLRSEECVVRHARRPLRPCLQ